MQWCRDHQFATFFFTPDESGVLGEVFIASTFVRLIDYDGLKHKEETYRHMLMGFRERLRLHTIVREHSEEFKRMQSRNLEHMAIFSAVITVVISAASVVTGSENVKVAREVLVDAGVGLGLFFAVAVPGAGTAASAAPVGLGGMAVLVGLLLVWRKQ